MSCVIVYDEDSLGDTLKNVMENISQRYGDLKEKMLNDTAINKLRADKIRSIQRFLAQLNYIYGQYSPQQIEELLANYSAGTAKKELSSNLEVLAKTSSGFLSADIDSGIKRQKFYQAIGSLYDLYEKGKSGMANNIDANSFLREANQLQKYISISGNQTLKETGNLLGHVGAIGGAIMVQDLVDNMVKQPLTQSNVVTYSTGEKQTTTSPKRKVTTDTTTIIYQQTGQGRAEVRAALRISNKFNAVYASGATNTGRAVKLATRNVKTFLQDLGNQKNVHDYEFALYNYLSYHKTFRRGHFERTDWTKTDPKGWKDLRRAVGAEIMYFDLYEGKGKFSIRGDEIEDVIDIYAYGDKLFLGDSILKTLHARKRYRNEFDMATISLLKREGLVENTQEINSPPRVENTEQAYQVLSSSSISYSQKIVFS